MMSDAAGSSVDQPAKEMPGMNDVLLKLTGLHLFASGVFSNVYRGTLHFQNGTKEIAIKKTWPETAEKNFETVFLTGINREKHKNVLSMMYAFSNRAKDGRICESYVSEFMPETLHATTRRVVLDPIDVKLYAFQLFHGLKYLASDLIIHRDIKPVNILVDHSVGLLRISDFGSAKIVRPGYPSTAYQVTRFYRPPELLLGSQYYDCTVDVWSGGCVFAEMVRRHVLFPGRDHKHQLKLVVQCLGMPDESDYEAMQCLPERVGRDIPTTTNLEQLIPDGKSDVIEIIEKILIYNPQKRLCGAELLRSPYFDALFVSGAQRSNGQLIADIITPADKAAACADVPKPKKSKMAALMEKKGADMSFDTKNSNPKRATSKERLPQVVLNASYESLLRMRKSSESRVNVTVNKTSRTSLQPVVQKGSSELMSRTQGKSMMARARGSDTVANQNESSNVKKKTKGSKREGNGKE